MEQRADEARLTCVEASTRALPSLLPLTKNE